ncbi:MAG TPA: adenylate/guanylate cyclase domain-containing protein [Stellaceae bacterium]|nr:adenylate/guanylate cyclase domain-containing protein [Stellaceae bacterium]
MTSEASAAAIDRMAERPTVTTSGDDLFTFVREYRGAARPIGGGDIVEWLLSEQGRGMEGVELFDALCWRMVGQGIPLWRANLSIGTLHPQIMGLGFRWWRENGRTQEFRIKHGMEKRSDYLDSPMRPAIEQGVTVRHRLEEGSAALEQYPLLRAFLAAGATDYLACPLHAFVGRHRVITWATDRPGGFTDAHLAAIEAILPAIAVVVETNALRRMSAILLDIYLGRTIGRHILDGEIFRGQGRRLRAALMAVDLRGFTNLADRMPGEELIRLLDDYFDAVAAAVHGEGGEILKFVGDGVLAIFEPDGRPEREAVRAALAAGQETLRRIDTTNNNRAAVGQELIAIGIGLHLGEVIYGNVGAADRLDYTAIGPAVNLVCRLEGLTKRLGRPLLLSESFAEAYGGGLVSLGFQPVRGLSEPQEIFAPPERSTEI